MRPTRTEPGADRLRPHAQASLERARRLALRLHAEELSPEHWLATLLEDETCAATRAVLHAFADPETIGIEVLALCEGIMVVGSGRTLPFSVAAVEVLRASHGAAQERGAASVGAIDVFRAALARLPATVLERLAGLGPAPAPGAAPSPGGVQGTSLFRRFTGEALRALGASAKVAGQLERAAIGPVHLLVGTLEASAEVREQVGVTAARVRMATVGLDEDPTPLPERHVEAGAGLLALLAALPAEAQTLDVLAWLLEHGSAELTALLRRQKVTTALVERCRGNFLDPD